MTDEEVKLVFCASKNFILIKTRSLLKDKIIGNAPTNSLLSQTKMKILIVAMAMNAGGAETHVLTLARALIRRGDSVTIASAGGKLAAAAEREGARTATLPLDKNSPLSLLRSVIGLARLCRGEHFDVLHAHGRIPALASHLARRLCRRVPPAVVTVHGIYSRRSRGAGLSKWGARTIAVSEDIAAHTSVTYGVPRERIDVIENGVEIPKHGAVYRADGLCILSTCRQDRDSCAAAEALCRILPELCHRYPRLSPHLTIVGGGERIDSIRAMAREACRAIGREAIDCPGDVADAAALCRDADLFVGTARSALEALAAGVPTLLFGDDGARGLTDHATLAAAAEDNLTCRCAPPVGDPDSFLLGELLRFAALDAAGREQLGLCGREWVAEKYDITNITERTAAVLRDVATSARRGLLICGYYGAGNLGDDASLLAIAEAARAADPDLPLTVLTRGEHTELLPPQAEHLPAADIWRVIPPMRRSRDFLLGGGSLLQDSTSLRSLIFYTCMTRMAHRFGCRVTILGGIGPLRGRLSRRIAAAAVRSADAVYARDALSARLFAELGAAADRIFIVRDPAYATRAADEAGATLKYLPAGRYIVVCPRSVRTLGRGGRELECCLFAELLQAVADCPADTSVLFAAFAPQDEAVCAELAGRAAHPVRLIPAGALTPGEMIRLMAGADRVIAMRLHAAIFAAVAGTPCTPLEYDPKFRALDTPDDAKKY